MLGCDCPELGGTKCSKPQDGGPMGCSAKKVKLGASQPKEVGESKKEILGVPLWLSGLRT